MPAFLIAQLNSKTIEYRDPAFKLQAIILLWYEQALQLLRIITLSEQVKWLLCQEKNLDFTQNFIKKYLRDLLS